LREDMIAWLYGLQHFGIKLGLDNIRALLSLLDHPERSFRNVHVAGTNGKGSVAAMLDAMLGASGLRAGLFTSPHLVRPNERIRIDGTDIGDEELHARLHAMRDRIEPARETGELAAHPSFFEVVTATALDAFHDHGLDVAVLEVGLGGRLDATNAVEADVGVVVSIGLDHVKTLGGTVERITGEKAGIVKPGMPVVSGVVQQVAWNVLQRTCRERGAQLIDARTRVRFTGQAGGRFALEGEHGSYDELEVGLPGRHQIDNARVALAALELLMERMGRRVEPGAVRRGLAEVRWPGRLQWLQPGAGRPRLLVDGAHNAAGMRRVGDFLGEIALRDAVLLFGATRGKPLEELLAPLAPHCRAAVIGRPPVDRGLEPAEVAVEARKWIDEVDTAEDAHSALAAAERIAGPEGTVLVTGSLYLVGDVLGVLSCEEVPGPVAM
jgi:dihydrofolate synthase/folylpolyglutamate synthase